MIVGLNNIFASMGQPTQLYSDEESSMRSLNMNSLLRENEIKSVQTTTYPHTVERCIITVNTCYIEDWIHESKIQLNW